MGRTKRWNLDYEQDRLSEGTLIAEIVVGTLVKIVKLVVKIVQQQVDAVWKRVFPLRLQTGGKRVEKIDDSSIGRAKASRAARGGGGGTYFKHGRSLETMHLRILQCYNAGTEHVEFSPTRQTPHVPSAKRREVFGVA